MKIFKTLLICSTFLFITLLWLTRLEWLPSQSAFALSNNVIWYYLMHLSMIGIFVWDYITNKKLQSLLVSLCGVGVLVFDMYSFPMIHNIATALLFLTASYNIIMFSNKKERKYSIINCSVAALFFLFGLLTEMHLFYAEAIVELCIGVSMARRVWLYE